MSEYSALYRYYDALMKDYRYDGLLGFVKEQIEPRGVKSGFEFACGTGKITVGLSRIGVDMTASDISPDMLNAAAGNADLHRQKITFIRQDVNKPVIPSKYDLIASFVDGFNYVSSAAGLKRLFAAISRSLNDDGLLIFDMSTVYKAKKLLSGKLYYEDAQGLTYFWRNSNIKKGAITMELTFFERSGGGYIRSDETNTQYFYDNQKIFELLRACGFTFSAFDGDSFGALRGASKRLLVAAKKARR
ncbi:MAG: class I SAM-dependent methyltransferase [Clostridiales bacterium]|jgi:SAM-dependent methyltransferase|nr:class I SAM-dependent methyltransferase [Clostridiales bacterium]